MGDRSYSEELEEAAVFRAMWRSPTLCQALFRREPGWCAGVVA